MRSMSEHAPSSPWLTRYAWLTAAATLGLICIGGLVTSKGVGMAVPDWPTSYGYNMFALPWQYWTGGIVYEHTHRLWATVVGVLVVFLTRWLGGHRARKPLAIVGLVELLAGLGLVVASAELRGTGHFLAGVGGVILLAALVWARSAPAPAPLPLLGWVALVLVQVQGLLGGLRVVWLKDELGVVHGVLAQAFLVLLAVIAWLSMPRRQTGSGSSEAPPTVRRLVVAGTALVVLQLVLGASMRHRHAGLAVPDFPLAHGRIWPRLDEDSIARYNRQRMEVHAVHPITATDVVLHMAHRVGAVAVVGAVGTAWWLGRCRWTRGQPLRRGLTLWAGLVGIQFALGALTVWTTKAADVATAHVAVGSLTLVVGVLLWLTILRERPAAVSIAASNRLEGKSATPPLTTPV